MLPLTTQSFKLVVSGMNIRNEMTKMDDRSKVKFLVPKMTMR